jgi:hypothetical protein
MFVQAIGLLRDAPGLGRKLQSVFDFLVRESLLRCCHDREREDKDKCKDNQAAHNLAKLLFFIAGQ